LMMEMVHNLTDFFVESQVQHPVGLYLQRNQSK